MKIKNEEEIKEVAVSAFSKCTCSEWLRWQDETTVKGLELLSIDIAKSIHTKLLESVIEGFEEWEKVHHFERCHGLQRESAKKAWQAARLSDAKLLKEKDERINELKDSVANLEFLLEGWQKDYKEAVKDIEFIGYLLEGDSYTSIGKALEEWYEEIKSKYGLDKQERKG